jgi:diaminopropionate ammonia-lyase
MFSNIYVNKIRGASDTVTVLPARPEVRAFHRSLPNYAPTPLISLPDIAKELGIGHVLLKYEGSRLDLPAFKILGASLATARSVAKKLNLPIVNNAKPHEDSLHHLAVAAQAADLTLYAATDGNHGRAVARMATYLGIRARIYVPRVTDEIDPEAKFHIASEGADVQIWDGDYDATVLATKSAAEDHKDGKGILISDTPLEAGDEVAQWIVDGYQTMFDEIEEQVIDITGQQNVTHVITPVGSGSLCQAVRIFPSASFLIVRNFRELWAVI